MRFEAVLRGHGPGAWTDLQVPEEVARQLGTRARVPVKGTINGHPIRTSLMPDGEGGFYMVANKAMQEAAGAGPGDTVTVALEQDDAPREVDVPDDLEQALAESADARDRWEEMSYSARREFVTWIEGAKRAETRQRRVEKSAALVAEGKRLKG